jgi:chromosome segregation ATPase
MDAKQELSDRSYSYDGYKSKCESLTKENALLRKRITEVTSRSRMGSLNESKLEDKVGTLQDNLSNAKSKGKNLMAENLRLSEQLKSISAQNESMKSEIKRVKQGKDSVDSNYSKLKKEHLKAISQYIKLKASQSNLSEESIIKKLPEGCSVSDVDRVIDELSDTMSRLNEMPIVFNDVRAIVNESKHLDPESVQTIEILKATKDRLS